MESFPALSPKTITLDSIELDPTSWPDEWRVQEENPGMRSWQNAVGDLLTIHLFQTRPDIGASLGDLSTLRAFFRTMVLKNGGGIVSVDVLDVGSLPSVRAIVKVPQEPNGTTYLASLTIPRRDFSFVVKVQCQEAEDIGARDKAVYGRFLTAGRLDPARPLVGWEIDPYDANRRDKVMRNGAEADEYDAQFPAHPLSRARRHIAAACGAIRLHDDVTRAAAFYGPD